ncbi:hypothetical protein [Pedobacter sp. L105]|nr:hypothetical protein [Pedobacter sp. L105]
MLRLIFFWLNSWHYQLLSSFPAKPQLPVMRELFRLHFIFQEDIYAI